MSNSTGKISKLPQGIHVMAKPTGPVCNLNCEYCFYLEKEALFPKNENYRMSPEVLKAYIDKYITSQPTPVVEFVWQGGEPTLLGLDFFRKVVELQMPYAKNKKILNSLQTNGTLLDDEWCRFLKRYSFLVGLSLDGPEKVHNKYRVDRGGKPIFDAVMRGLKLLQKHGVEYNAMACVARETAKDPWRVYNFFKEQGIKFIQFVPIVERISDESAKKEGLKLAGPAALDKEEPNKEVTPWTVDPEEYGDFLIEICEEWVRKDVGKIFVMNFEWALQAYIGNPSPVCVFAQQCGKTVVLEHNGDVYACDHCVYPKYKLGNILNDDILKMVEQSQLNGFGIAKESALPKDCRECDVLNACYGGCPKHRFMKSYYGEPGMNYLCKGYEKFFLHIGKYLKVITQLLSNDLPASMVMKTIDKPLVINLDRIKK